MYSDFEEVVTGARPCPFCGNREIVAQKKDWFVENDIRIIFLKCGVCGCRKTGDVHDEYEDALKSAVDGWNRRAE